MIGPPPIEDADDRGRSRAALWGFYGYQNLGDDLMLDRLAEVIRQATDDEPVVLTGPGARVDRFQSYHMRPYWHWWPRIEPASRSLGIGYWFRCWPSRIEYMRALKDVDFLVLGGGSLLRVDGHWLPGLLDQLGYAHRQGKRVVLYGIGAIGRLRLQYQRDALRRLLALSHVTVFRDASSHSLALDCGYSGDSVHLAADPLYPLAEEETVLVRRYREAAERPVVGIAPRFSADWRGGNEELVRELASLTKALLARGQQVVLLAFGERVDMSICRAVMSTVGDRRGVSIMPLPRPPDLLRLSFARMSCVVAMPLHAMLLATIFGTPVVPLSYAPKCNAFCAEVGVEPILHDLTQDTLPSAERLLNMVTAAQRHYAQNARYIADLVQQQRAKTHRGEALLRQALST